MQLQTWLKPMPVSADFGRWRVRVLRLVAGKSLRTHKDARPPRRRGQPRRSHRTGAHDSMTSMTVEEHLKHSHAAATLGSGSSN